MRKDVRLQQFHSTVRMPTVQISGVVWPLRRDLRHEDVDASATGEVLQVHGAA